MGTTEKATSEDIKAAFDSLDTDGSGFIDVADLEKVTRKLDANLDRAQLQSALDDMMPGGDGRVSFEQFQWWWVRQQKSAVALQSVGHAVGRTAVDAYP